MPKIARIASRFVLLGGLLLLGGCNFLGAVAAKTVPPDKIAAAYYGLKGQRVGIMCWADSADMIDHPHLRTDVAAGLQDKLKEAAKDGADEVKDIIWVDSHKIADFQDAHPELEADSAQQVAPLLPPMTRLVYIEITSLSLHPNISADLSRGSVTANVTVVELIGGSTRMAYQENNISVIYPSDAPPEGLPNLRDEEVYQQTIGALTTEIGERFVTHQQDDKESQP